MSDILAMFHIKICKRHKYAVVPINTPLAPPRLVWMYLNFSDPALASWRVLEKFALFESPYSLLNTAKPHEPYDKPASYGTQVC